MNPTQENAENQPQAEAVSAKAANQAAYKTLCKRFAVLREKKPLAIGILQQLDSAQTGFSKTRLRHIMRFHVHNKLYLESVAKGGVRYNLDGSESEAISEEALNYSKECLKTLREKAQAQKPNAKKAFPKKTKTEDEKVSVASKDSARLQKLQLLAKKFGKKE